MAVFGSEQSLTRLIGSPQACCASQPGVRSMHDLTATDRCVGQGAAAMMDDARPGAARTRARGDKSGGDVRHCLLDRTLDHLRSHLAQSVSLETLAGMNGRSRSSFCRWFKAATGLPPHQWLLRARIVEATRLLAEESQPLSEVALAVGFTDQAHFGRTFKRVTGATPRAWQSSGGTRLDSAPALVACLASQGKACILN